MKPFLTLARAPTPDGAELTLQEHDGQHYLKLNGRQLMSTSATLSEMLLGELGCAGLRDHTAPRVLIGGLGFGFTLRAVLHSVGSAAIVEVAELIPEVITWNRDLLGRVNGALLDDERVKIYPANVFNVIKNVPRGKYDAILLDLDDGPVGFIQGKKSYKYDYRGCGRIRRALTPNGRAAFWSAGEDRPFEQSLRRAGFHVQVRATKAHAHARQELHRIYLAEFPIETEGFRTEHAEGTEKKKPEVENSLLSDLRAFRALRAKPSESDREVAVLRPGHFHRRQEHSGADRRVGPCSIRMKEPVSRLVA